MLHTRSALLAAGVCTVVLGTATPALAHTQTVQPPGHEPVVSGRISKPWAHAHCESQAPAVVGVASNGVVTFLPVYIDC